jgi:hypothetical protein
MTTTIAFVLMVLCFDADHEFLGSLLAVAIGIRVWFYLSGFIRDEERL